MDNLARHKVAGVRHAIEAVGARVLSLPRFSLGFNPIEQLFAKLKALLKKAATRTIDTLWAVVGKILPRLPPNECRDYFANAAYRHSM